MATVAELKPRQRAWTLTATSQINDFEAGIVWFKHAKIQEFKPNLSAPRDHHPCGGEKLG